MSDITQVEQYVKALQCATVQDSMKKMCARDKDDLKILHS
jgi:hypothetical protein